MAVREVFRGAFPTAGPILLADRTGHAVASLAGPYVRRPLTRLSTSGCFDVLEAPWLCWAHRERSGATVQIGPLVHGAPAKGRCVVFVWVPALSLPCASGGATRQSQTQPPTEGPLGHAGVDSGAPTEETGGCTNDCGGLRAGTLGRRRERKQPINGKRLRKPCEASTPPGMKLFVEKNEIARDFPGVFFFKKKRP